MYSRLSKLKQICKKVCNCGEAMRHLCYYKSDVSNSLTNRPVELHKENRFKVVLVGIKNKRSTQQSAKYFAK